jgi:molybdate transport system substrate-binding protein
MKRLLLAGLLGIALGSDITMAAEVKVLSAGAVEPGLHRAVEQFKRASGHSVSIQFNTAPQIAQRMSQGYVADVLIAPPAVLDERANNNKVSGEGRVMLGRVGAGVAVRQDATPPNVATTDALKQAVLGADSLVYNTASTGLYIERLFDRLGVGEQLKAKTKRYATGAEVMEHVIKGTGNELGLGPITEIKLYDGKGLKLVGPLPADVQNYTSYGAALMTGAPSPDGAKAFLSYLGSPEAKQAFNAAGIE